VRSLTPLIRWARRIGRGASAIARVPRSFTVLARTLDAILVIPALSEQLEQVVRNTASLPTLSPQLERVATNTDELALVAASTTRLVDQTSVLPQTHTELLVMQAAIVQMQANTTAMAGDVSRLVKLEQAVPALVPMLDDVGNSVRRLAELADPLEGVAARVGRLSDRLPKRRAHLNGG
jgi:hypothetical protein